MSAHARNAVAGPAAVAVAGLVLLGLGQGIVNRHSIEDALTTESAGALTAAGVTGVQVTFTGRDADLIADDADAGAMARDVVLGVDGVRVASVTVRKSAALPAPSATPEPSPSGLAPPATAPATATGEPTAEPAPSATGGTAPTLPIGLTFDSGALILSGSVPSQDAHDDVVAAAGQVRFGWRLIDRLTIDPAVAPVKPGWYQALTTLMGTVPPRSSRLVVVYRDDTVLLRGTPSTGGLERRLLGAAAGTVSRGGQVVDGMDVPVTAS